VLRHFLFVFLFVDVNVSGYPVSDHIIARQKQYVGSVKTAMCGYYMKGRNGVVPLPQ